MAGRLPEEALGGKPSETTRGPRIVASEFDNKTTLPENREMVGEGTHQDEGAILTAAGTRERIRAGHDRFAIHEKRLEQLGINTEKEVPKWPRDDRKWNDIGDNAMSLSEYLAVTGGRIVTTKGLDGKSEPVVNGDNILVAVPKEFEDAYAAEQAEEQRRALENWVGGDITDSGSGNVIPRYNESATQYELEMMRDREKEVSKNAGFIGEFQGQPWQNVFQNLSREEWERMEDKARGGPRGAAGRSRGQGTGRDDYRNDADDQRANDKDNQRRQSEQSRNSGGKFISIPQNVRSRNHAGANK